MPTVAVRSTNRWGVNLQQQRPAEPTPIPLLVSEPAAVTALPLSDVAVNQILLAKHLARISAPKQQPGIDSD